MAGILYKWFFSITTCFFLTGTATHPIYVSVTEIELNTPQKNLEISCKLFTDDFEKVLRTQYKTIVDLINPGARKAAMDKLVSEYVQAHLKITADGRQLNLRYLGYEIIEEGVQSYFEVPNIDKLKNIAVFNNLLYEYNEQQMGLIHVTVNGNRKSTKLNYPETKASLSF
jgi:hypothetical protein